MSLSRLNRKSTNRRIAKYIKVSLTNAQLLAMNATPITVIAAPPTGFVHIIDRIYGTKIAGTAYTIGSNAGIDFKYTNSSGVVCANLPTTGFLDQTTAQQSSTVQTAGLIPVANAVVVAQSKTAEVTGTGAPAISLRIYFRTLPVAL